MGGEDQWAQLRNPRAELLVEVGSEGGKVGRCRGLRGKKTFGRCGTAAISNLPRRGGTNRGKHTGEEKKKPSPLEE